MKNFASTKIQKHQVLVTEYSFVSSKCVMKFSEEAHPRQVQPVLGPCKYSTKQVFIPCQYWIRSFFIRVIAKFSRYLFCQYDLPLMWGHFRGSRTSVGGCVLNAPLQNCALPSLTWRRLGSFTVDCFCYSLNQPPIFKGRSETFFDENRNGTVRTGSLQFGDEYALCIIHAVWRSTCSNCSMQYEDQEGTVRTVSMHCTAPLPSPLSWENVLSPHRGVDGREKLGSITRAPKKLKL